MENKIMLTEKEIKVLAETYLSLKTDKEFQEKLKDLYKYVNRKNEPKEPKHVVS